MRNSYRMSPTEFPEQYLPADFATTSKSTNSASTSLAEKPHDLSQAIRLINQLLTHETLKYSDADDHATVHNMQLVHTSTRKIIRTMPQTEVLRISVAIMRLQQLGIR